MQFTKATQMQGRLRMALIGPSGSGKTYTAMNIGQHLGLRVAVIDTERGSASKYASLFNFDVLELDTFSPQTYVQAIQAADAAGYDVLIIDSLSHAWSGKGGALEMVDAIAKRSQSPNSFGAWRDVTPIHNQMVDAMLSCRAHVIATIRSKTEHVQEKDERGKTVIRKVGLQPVQRDGLEYEFDVVADLTQDNELIVSKSRCPALSGVMVSKPGKEVADTLRTWLEGGAPLPPEPSPAEQAAKQRTAEALQDFGARNGQAVTPAAPSSAPPSGKEDEPITDEQRDRYRALLKEAEDAKLDLTPYEVNLDTLTKVRFRELGTKLKQAIDAQPKPATT